MKNDTNVLKAYMKMLLEGDAFNEKKPDKATRKRLVESILKNKQYQEWLSPKIKNRSGVNFQSVSAKLEDIIEDEFFKEDEFLV